MVTVTTADEQLDLYPFGAPTEAIAGDEERSNAAPQSALRIDLNPEQLACVEHAEGPLYNAAVAGAGKTRTVIERIKRLVSRGVPAERILAVTFSKKAAGEMQDRLDADMPGSGARIGTWHSLAYEVIRKDELPQARWQVDQKDRYRYLAKEAMGYKHLDWKRGDITKVLGFVGWCKAQLWTPDALEASERAKMLFGLESRQALSVWRIADELCRGACVLTFDDMLVFAAEHLRLPDNAERWAARWDHVIVDEAQDNSLAQIEMLRALGRGHRNVHVCGDPSQAVYSFRGSSPQHLVDFLSEWSASAVYMCRNYRSGRAIIAAANRAIAPAKVRLPVEMVAERDHDGTVAAVECEDLDDEGRHFVEWARQHREDGRRWSDFFVLYRTNAQSRAVEEALLGARIPYVVVGGTSFYDRKEVKDLLAYLRVASGADRDGDAVKRCINAPFRFLGRAFVDRVLDLARPGCDWGEVVARAAQQGGVQRRQQQSAQDWALLVAQIASRIAATADSEDKGPPDSPSRPAQVLKDLVARTGYVEWLQKEEGEESIENSRASNVRELCRVAERFATVAELLGYIDESIAASKRQEKAGGDRVVLMSCHRAKGLEAPCVWVVGCCEGVLPHAKGDPEEERRLFYVAVTRARDHLVCSYPRSMATSRGVRDMAPSPFLADAGMVPGGIG